MSRIYEQHSGMARPWSVFHSGSIEGFFGDTSIEMLER